MRGDVEDREGKSGHRSSHHIPLATSCVGHCQHYPVFSGEGYVGI